MEEQQKKQEIVGATAKENQAVAVVMEKAKTVEIKKERQFVDGLMTKRELKKEGKTNKRQNSAYNNLHMACANTAMGGMGGGMSNGMGGGMYNGMGGMPN